MNKLEPYRRRTVLLAAGGVLCSTLPTLALLPLRQAHVVGDKPYFLGVGFCLGVAVVLLVLAMQATVRGRQAAGQSER